MIDCIVEQRGDFFVCTACNFGDGRMRKPFRRNCPKATREMLMTDLHDKATRRVMIEYRSTCSCRSVSLIQLAERLAECDSCTDREDSVCLEASSDMCDLGELLACRKSECPRGKWLAKT